MPKLSELKPDQYKVVSTPDGGDQPLKLSSLKPDSIKIVSEPKEQDRLSKAESVISGISKGLTFGFDDEIIGAARAGLGKLQGEGSFKDLYPKYRDEQRGYSKQAHKDNPGSELTGNVVGSVGTGLFPVVGPLASASKGASTASVIAKGAALGGIVGAGESESNPIESPKQAKEFATDVASGAAIGGVLSGAGKKIGDAVSFMTPSGLREYANRRALTAAGFMTKDIKKLSPEMQQEIGANLLSNKVVTAFASLDDVAERSGALKKSAGNAIGKALSTVDDHVKELSANIDSGKLLQGATDEQKAIAKKFIADNFQFNMQRVGQRIRDELIAPNADNPLVKNELSRLSQLAQDFSQKTIGGDVVEMAPKSLGFGNFIKSTQGKSTRFQSETVPEQFKKDVYTIIKEELENAVAGTGNLESDISALGSLAGGNKAIGSASDIARRNNQALSEYGAAKKTYGAMSATQKAVTDSLGRTNANRTISLTDYIAGTAGAAAGGPVPAVALGALNKLARKYGASVQAVSANTLADGLEAVKGVTTDQLASAIGKVVSSSPELSKKFGNVVITAAQQGKPSLVAVHYALMKEPAYVKAMESNQPEAKNPFERRLNQMKSNGK